MHCFVKVTVIKDHEALSQGHVIGKLSRQALPLYQDVAVMVSLQYSSAPQLYMMVLDANDFTDSNTVAVSIIG